MKYLIDFFGVLAFTILFIFIPFPNQIVLFAALVFFLLCIAWVALVSLSFDMSDLVKELKKEQ